MNRTDQPTWLRMVDVAAAEAGGSGLTVADVRGLNCHGTVHHVRLEPRRHAFRYRVWMLLVDLERQPATPWWLRPVIRFDGLMAAEAVRERLSEVDIETRSVRILALTQPASLGHSFNPVNFYFCERQGDLMALLVQVTNTPWGETHCYVLDARGRPLCGSHRFDFAKAFHVSPFLSMQGRYCLRLDVRDDRLRIALRLVGGSAPFSACLSLLAQPFTYSAVLAASLRRPAQNALTLLRIYWQAGRLLAKHVPFFSHPGRAR